jgi:hypothetical protein
MENFSKSNPLGLKLMHQMQADSEQETELTGEQIEDLAAMRAEGAERLAEELHQLAQVPGDEPPTEGMFATWKKWAQENLPEE